jgi:aspartate-semialdehyde dehydrogenase
MSRPESPNIAVVGATGEVGRVMLSQIHKRIPGANIFAFASERSSGGALLPSPAGLLEVRNAATANLEGIDVALFSAGSGPSLELAPRFVEAGAVVVDNSSAWRMDPDVPLVINGVNPSALDNIPKGIVSNPNCTTMIGITVVNPLHLVAGIKAIDATTMQGTAGAGRAGINELIQQIQLADRRTLEGLVGGDRGRLSHHPAEVFADTIAFNVVPTNGEFDGRETAEEHKFRDESRKILGLSGLAVSASCNRVSVFTGHSIDLKLDFELSITPEEAEAVLAESPGIRLVDLPTPLGAAGVEEVLVGRIRQRETVEHGLVVFVCGDNLLWGAALNAVKLAEKILERI